MKISVQDGKSCEKILKVEVARDAIQKEFEEFYNSVAPKASIPGFRPGKAPRSVLVMHYKEQARENVLKHLISESYRRAVQEKSLEPLGFPEIEDVKFLEDSLSYKAKIEIRPKIKLSKTAGLAVKKEGAELKPGEVEESLAQLQESLAQYKAVEDRPAAMGDYVIADYVCTVDGRETEHRTGDWFELREEEYLKGFSRQLAGAKPGEEKQVVVNFPADSPRKNLAGKEAHFKVKVSEIKTKILPPLDDELAKQAGEFKTLAELRARVEKNLKQQKENQNEAAYEKALLDELVKQNKIDLPEGLISRRLDQLVLDALGHYRRQRVPESELQGIAKKLQTELAAEARRQVHLAFLLDEIAAKENVTVAEDDYQKKYRQMAEQMHQPEEKVSEYYKTNEERREALADQIRNEKVIGFLKKNAKA